MKLDLDFDPIKIERVYATAKGRHLAAPPPALRSIDRQCEQLLGSSFRGFFNSCFGTLDGFASSFGSSFVDNGGRIVSNGGGVSSSGIGSFGCFVGALRAGGEAEGGTGNGSSKNDLTHDMNSLISEWDARSH